MENSKWFSKKVVILGYPATGKTSLINRYVYHKFSEEYMSTIGLNIVKKSMHFEDKVLDLILWEVAGQEKMWKSYLKGCEAIVYVVALYDILEKKPFSIHIQNIKKLVAEQIEKINTLAPGINITLVANMSDKITPIELEIAKQMLVPTPQFFTSAKTGENVETFFHHVGSKLLEKYS